MSRLRNKIQHSHTAPSFLEIAVKKTFCRWNLTPHSPLCVWLRHLKHYHFKWNECHPSFLTLLPLLSGDSEGEVDVPMKFTKSFKFTVRFSTLLLGRYLELKTAPHWCYHQSTFYKKNLQTPSHVRLTIKVVQHTLEDCDWLFSKQPDDWVIVVEFLWCIQC